MGGREAAAQIPPLLDAVSEQALADLDDTEREALVRLLQRVTANLGWPPAPSRNR